MKYTVRAADYEAGFVEKETFDSIDNALDYADRMGEIFGSWNVEVYSNN